MSLVNEMLTDLQKNKTVSPLPSSPVDYFVPVNDHYKHLSITSITIVVISIAMAIFLIPVNNSRATNTISEPVPKLLLELKKDETYQQVLIENTKSFDLGNVSFEPEKVELDVSKIIKKNNLVPFIADKEQPKKVIETVKKIINKPSNKTVKTTSRKTLASNNFTRLMTQWKTLNNQTRSSKMKSFFLKYIEQPEALLRALSFLKSKQDNSFNQFIAIAEKKFPENHQFTYLSARYYFDKGDFQKSIHQIEKIPKTAAQLIDFQLLGFAYQKIGQHQKAINSYQKLLLTRPLRGDINMAIGISYVQLKEDRNAAKYFSIALNDNNLNLIQKKFVRQRLKAYQG